MPVRMVAFDVGETLVSEQRVWGEWADWLGVPRLTFFAALGAVIAEGRDHREAFTLVRPGFNLAQATRARLAEGWSRRIAIDDLYPDALPCLAELRRRGYRIAIVGNQPREWMDGLNELGVHADLIASSEEWGVAKPAPGFFDRLVEAAQLPPGDIAYVGDRLDNDVLPAIAGGLVGVFVRRGPWGARHATGDRARAFAARRTDRTADGARRKYLLKYQQIVSSNCRMYIARNAPIMISLYYLELQSLGGVMSGGYGCQPSR
jgi:FMN phosphatase YigB (HAD superfamily)